MTSDRLLSRRALDALNVAVIVLIIVAQVSLVGVAVWQGVQLRAQNAAIVRQNAVQICAQRSILEAVRSIKRNLGLPTDDIVLPDVSGLACPT